MNVHIKSEIPVIITIGDTEKHLNTPSSLLSFKTEVNKLLIKCQPLIHEYQSQKVLPCLFTLDLKNLNNNPLCQIIVYPHQNIEVLLKANLIPNMAAASENLAIEGHSFILKSGGADNANILIENDDLVFFKQLNFSICSIKHKIIGNSAIIEAEGKEKNHLLILQYNDGFKEYFSHDINNLIVDGDSVTALCRMQDIAKQGRTFSFRFFKKEISHEYKTVYLNNKPNIVKTSAVIPFAFFEAVKLNNYNLCKYYMTAELKSKLSDRHLAAFFEGACEIRQNIYNPEYKNTYFLIFNEGGIFKAKLYEFKLENGKINNIIEI